MKLKNSSTIKSIRNLRVSSGILHFASLKEKISLNPIIFSMMDTFKRSRMYAYLVTEYLIQSTHQLALAILQDSIHKKSHMILILAKETVDLPFSSYK
jgi:hypothetical protein